MRCSCVCFHIWQVPSQSIKSKETLVKPHRHRQFLLSRRSPSWLPSTSVAALDLFSSIFGTSLAELHGHGRVQSENSRRLWLSEIPCWKVFGQILTLLENSSPIFGQHEMLSLPRFGHFPAMKAAAGKLAAPSGTLLDFLLWDRHCLLEFFWYK